MERARDESLQIELSQQVRALVHQAGSTGPVDAGRLWDALPTTSEREWLRLPAESRPKVAPDDPPSGGDFDGRPLTASGALALRLARFLAFHYEDPQVELGHVAVALAGLPEPLRRMPLMQAAADAYFDAELVALDLLLPRFGTSPAAPQASVAPPRRGLWGSFKAKQAWKQRLFETINAYDQGKLAEALRLAGELVGEAEHVRPAALDLVFVCEIGATAALFGPTDLQAAGWFCDRGLTFSAALEEPTRALMRGRLLQQQATTSFNLGDLAATEAQLQASGHALAACEAHPVARLPFVRPKLVELGVSHRLTAAQLLHSLGRWDEALELAGAATAYAEQRGSRGKSLLALTVSALLLMEIGDEPRLTALAGRLFSFDLATDLAPLHATVRVGVVGVLTEVEVWLCERRGDRAGAVSALTEALEVLDEAPDSWSTTRDKRGRLLSRLAAVHVRERDARAAHAVLERLQPDRLLETDARGEVLAVWLDFLRLAGDRERVLTAMQDFDRRHGPHALLPQEVVEVLSAVAEDAATIGEPTQALAYVERVTAAMARLTGGRLPAGIRSSVLDTRTSARNVSLRVAAGVAFVDADRAGRAALQCADTWRESTLALAVGADLGPLPPAVRDLVQQIEHATVATGAAPQDHRGVPVPAVAAEAARQAAGDRLAELREELGQAIGFSLSRLLIPAPRSAVPVAGGPQEALLSVTALPGRSDDGGMQLVAAWQLPDGTAGVSGKPIGADAVRVVRQLSGGLSFESLTDLEDWQEAWEEVATELAVAIVPLPVRNWLERATRPTIRYAFDGLLGNVPLVALPLDEGRRVLDVAAVNRVPFLRSLAHTAQHPSVRPRVLAYLYGTEATTAEREQLQRLDRAGRIELTLAPSLADVVPLLSRGEFDVLTLSCHGSGRGLNFRFHDDAPQGHELFAHQLLAVRVPPLVVAASCYSGTEGAVDITGLLATVLSRGAESVVAGSWALPDEDTAELLSAFYELLDAPDTPAQRLRSAQTGSGVSTREVPSWAGLTCTTL